MSVEQIIDALKPTDGGGDVSKALAALSSHGFPARKTERWKYTRSEPFATFAAASLASDSASSTDIDSILSDWKSETGASAVAVFVGGVFDDERSDVPGGITIQAIDVAPAVGSDSDAADALVWLNTAAANGRYQISAESAVEQTLHCVHLPAGENSLAQTRVHISIAPNARLSIVDHVLDGGVSASMQTLITTADIGREAQLDHVRLQHAAAAGLVYTRFDADIANAAICRTLTLDSGGSLVRNDLNLRLNAAGAEAHLNGIYLANDRQHVDNHTQVEHVSPNTISRENYRGILRDRSRSVFNGKVLVHEGADGTDSAQSNATLLLSDHAEIDTKPELEIYADDVKCAHGATVGQLDQTSLFYLQSRGIDKSMATQLLTYAFCREITSEIADDHVRGLADSAIAAEIPNFTALEAIA